MKKLYTFNLAKKLRGDKNTRAFTRAFFKRFEYEDVRITRTGVLVVFIWENAWIFYKLIKTRISRAFIVMDQSQKH